MTASSKTLRLFDPTPAIKRRLLEPLDPERTERRTRDLVVTAVLGVAVIGVLALLVWRPWRGPTPTGPGPAVPVREGWAPLARLRGDPSARDR